jgi:hypothetical protein
LTDSHLTDSHCDPGEKQNGARLYDSTRLRFHGKPAKEQEWEGCSFPHAIDTKPVLRQSQ